MNFIQLTLEQLFDYSFKNMIQNRFSFSFFFKDRLTACPRKRRRQNVAKSHNTKGSGTYIKPTAQRECYSLIQRNSNLEEPLEVENPPPPLLKDRKCRV